jgi:hypothetical protein
MALVSYTVTGRGGKQGCSIVDYGLRIAECFKPQISQMSADYILRNKRVPNHKLPGSKYD